MGKGSFIYVFIIKLFWLKELQEYYLHKLNLNLSAFAINLKLKSMIKKVHKNITYIYTDDLNERIELVLDEINKYKIIEPNNEKRKCQ